MDHGVYGHESILKLISYRFGLGFLNKRHRYARNIGRSFDWKNPDFTPPGLPDPPAVATSPCQTGGGGGVFDSAASHASDLADLEGLAHRHGFPVLDGKTHNVFRAAGHRAPRRERDAREARERRRQSEEKASLEPCAAAAGRDRLRRAGPGRGERRHRTHDRRHLARRPSDGHPSGRPHQRRGRQRRAFGRRGGNDRSGGGRATTALSGGRGRDRLSGGTGRDTLSGGPGADRLSGGPDRDRMNGGSGGDRIDGGSGADLIKGVGGADTLIGFRGNDRLDGGAGNDRLLGGRGATGWPAAPATTSSTAAPDADMVVGRRRLRTALEGGGGNDRLIGGAGEDDLDGGNGNDFIDARDGSEDSIAAAAAVKHGDGEKGEGGVDRREFFLPPGRRGGVRARPKPRWR